MAEFAKWAGAIPQGKRPHWLRLFVVPAVVAVASYFGLGHS